MLAIFILSTPLLKALEPDYLDFNYQHNVSVTSWQETIQIVEPACRSEVQGVTQVKFIAPGMYIAKAMCWQQPTDENPDPAGHDALLTSGNILLNEDGEGSFSFDADTLPSGPINVRIFAESESRKKDIFELQLYNKGGVLWAGVPDTVPAAAADNGLILAFIDDFDGPMSISDHGIGTRYSATPLRGNFSGWPFIRPSHADGSPFDQFDTFLKISARKKSPELAKGTTGFIGAVNAFREGAWIAPPCYLECRLTAQSAPGTWPAFWTIDYGAEGPPGDELDIVEAYGGVGPGNPNHIGYTVSTHFHGQEIPRVYKQIPMTTMGNRSYWSTTFHTYGVLVTEEETVYYLDDMEVFRHETREYSKTRSLYFMINYAIGGTSGWPINLERYGNASDMYVDYVRVYNKSGETTNTSTTSISATTEAKDKVTSLKDKIQVEAAASSSLVVYNLNGSIFLQQDIPAGQTTIPLPAGFYIVKLNGSSHKVIIGNVF